MVVLVIYFVFETFFDLIQQIYQIQQYKYHIPFYTFCGFSNITQKLLFQQIIDIR